MGHELFSSFLSSSVFYRHFQCASCELQRGEKREHRISVNQPAVEEKPIAVSPPPVEVVTKVESPPPAVETPKEVSPPADEPSPSETNSEPVAPP